MLTKDNYKQLITKIVMMYPGITGTALRIKVLDNVGPMEHDYVTYETALEEMIEERKLVNPIFRLETGLVIMIYFPKDTAQVNNG